MSRETDSSSSGPQGRGGAAYPSGTPPYGSRQYPSLHPQQDPPEETGIAAAAQPDEPKTETTLTTRIRINIPGSRPIPPVVMRTPVGDADTAGGRGVKASEQTGGVPAQDEGKDVVDAPVPEAADEKPSGDKPASDWFAPRKPAAGTPGGPGSGTGTGGAGMAAGMGAGAAAVAGSSVPAQTGPGADRRTDSPYYGDYSEAPRQHPPTGGGSLSELAAGAGLPSGQGAGAFAPGGGPTTPALGIRPPGPAGGPSGPTAGPVTGSTPLGTQPPALGAPSGAGQGGPPRMSDDTAELTPQQHAPGPGPGGHVSGDTLTSGIPVVPAESRSPFPGSGPGTDQMQRPGGPATHGQDQGFSAPDFPGAVGSSQGGGPAPARTAPPAAAAPAAAPARKKGRSKLTLLVGVLLVGAGGVYGAGLLMNHSDVPKGTTVLGVDIGGGTRDAAVIKLDTALGERASQPLRLSVGGKTEELAPDKAGLSLDSQATVRAAAGSDYNPVSVIGSLFGGQRIAQPVIPVDEEKLSSALTDLAGVSGSATEGTIRFEPGRAVAVPGKSGESLDVSHSIISVRDAYRAQVQTGSTNTVELPIAPRDPTISQAELDRAMNEFAKPAMSDLITIKAGGKEIQFGPAKSLPKILSMKAIDGRLVEVYDKKAIEELLDGVFDGITITKGDGKEHPVSADDVAQAMQKALLGKTPAERTQVIELNPS
ncbi:hypothetical protein KQY30_11970 [Streptomyces sp. GMY02]|uniref:hypothetical protein n=1 Tax=Streptomyces sp. GMY02 TaxID=1333528 RepID=UPI001C2CA319|nr:hypothetical protein [Streptomyces sp. GMY02]QXE34883.1 hypothetical protein KQY30_11970 [Streptomyces sp. GMY02]